MEHYVEVAIEKLRDQKAVELVQLESDDDDMAGSASSQVDEVKPKISILQLTEYVIGCTLLIA